MSLVKDLRKPFAERVLLEATGGAISWYLGIAVVHGARIWQLGRPAPMF
jgi:hypothetical protein